MTQGCVLESGVQQNRHANVFVPPLSQHLLNIGDDALPVIQEEAPCSPFNCVCSTRPCVDGSADVWLLPAMMTV